MHLSSVLEQWEVIIKIHPERCLCQFLPQPKEGPISVHLQMVTTGPVSLVITVGQVLRSNIGM